MTAIHAGIPNYVMHSIFDRNIRNSLLVTGGEFETVLADIIEQLEHPPMGEDRQTTAWETARMIAEAMSAGFAGLPPNGFEFACWLWETAPLHIVSIPHANSIGTSHGFRYGVVHLRKIAAMLAGSYLRQQPQKEPQVVELIDMSLDWVDARNLINFALLEHYVRYFTQELPALRQLAATAKSWRALIPLGVAARIIGTQPAAAADAYSIVRISCVHAADPHVLQALRYLFRVAGLYGDRKMFTDFMLSLQDVDQPVINELAGDSLRPLSRPAQ